MLQAGRLVQPELIVARRCLYSGSYPKIDLFRRRGPLAPPCRLTFGDSENTVGVPSYTVLDVALHYERNGWEAALNVSNLFDEILFLCQLP